MRAMYMYRNTKLSETEEIEVKKLKRIKHGTLLTDFEVPFTYTEDNVQKTELVKLRLCARCAILLFVTRGEEYPSLAACQARREGQNHDKARHESDADKQNEPSSRKSRKRKKKKKRRDDDRDIIDRKRHRKDKE